MLDKEKYRKEGKEFVLSRGEKSYFYYDFLPGVIEQDILLTIQLFIYDLNNGKEINLVGLETFGMNIVSILYHTQIISPDPLIIINPIIFLKPRENRDRLIGKFNEKLDTFLIDDVITSGKTFMGCLDFIATYYIPNDSIKGLLCLINRSTMKTINDKPIAEIN